MKLNYPGKQKFGSTTTTTTTTTTNLKTKNKNILIGGFISIFPNKFKAPQG